jgi:cytochrome oxidase Cu insertion factor (SCO1/SenC/PrrC family)
VENRLAEQRPSRPGAALIGLAAILAITAAWWALALWPAGAVEPEWLARTRAACFGSARGGLPDAGGWILLVGEPIGLLTALVMGFGDSLRRDLHRLAASRSGRIATAGAAAVMILVLGTIGTHLVRSWAAVQPVRGSGGYLLTRVEQALPQRRLTDQAGRRITLVDHPGQPMLLTFAYGHCTTVCPTLVSDVRAARRTSGHDIRLVVLTLDPWRDTPDRLPGIARRWNVDSADRVLSGDVSDVERTLDELGIGRRRSETNGDLDHGATVLLVDARGRITWRLDGGSAGIPLLLGKL